MLGTIEISADRISTSSKKIKLRPRKSISGTAIKRSSLFHVYDFTPFAEKIYNTIDIGYFRPPVSESYLMMLASEDVLRRDWDTPEEDEAWIDL